MASKSKEKARALEKLKKSKAESGRKMATRSKVVRFLIVCEGSKTEPNYFKALIKNSRYSDVIEADIDGKGMNTCSLVEWTGKRRKELERSHELPFDRVWAVFDRDSFPRFNEAIDLAERMNICAAWSNEAFELWYYLHFEFLDTAIDRNEYIVKLNNLIRRYPGYVDFNYKKNDPNFYQVLQDIGNEDLAKKSAARLRASYKGHDYKEHRPCTMVDRLVDELENPLQVLDH